MTIACWRRLVTDPNGNQSAVAFDPLGMVVAIAVMGVAGSNEGDTLADPTTRIEYNLLAWEAAAPSPAYVHTSARLQHGPTNPGWFETYSYSDGSGHEVLEEVQAEPDATNAPRWAATGRTAYDNKGNPVKIYEPYFAAGPEYDTEAGLRPAAIARSAATIRCRGCCAFDLADGTFTTSEFDSWSEIRADGDDNVLASAWYQDASTRPASDPLNRAAVLAAADANTPLVRMFDPLGRMFLAIADNGPAGKYPTRTKLDIQGNPLVVTDALGNATLAAVFDALGQKLEQTSPDNGTSLAIKDAAGKPYRDFDVRGFARRRVYDVLGRRTQLLVTPPAGTEFLAEQAVYGEGLATPNFRGRLYQTFDGAGFSPMRSTTSRAASPS